MAGNFIGTDVTGTLALGNGGDGMTIEMGASSNFIGGVDTNSGGSLAGLGNVISANKGNGILITGAGATGMQIEGNDIGTNLSGSAALGNGRPMASTSTTAPPATWSAAPVPPPAAFSPALAT